ncbi:MAG: L-serine ammonia-lyase [Alphaproteobacteria bacterium]|nr:L-serine ammonia-lyase [Alphaproteobacteria bacterium]
MSLSIFDLYKVGIGPSSSHTVGPMWAAHRFLLDLEARGILGDTASVEVGLYGSLAVTGHGHGTDLAILLGLMGETPDRVDPDRVDELVGVVRELGRLKLAGRHDIPFREADNLMFNFGEMMPMHPNGMRFIARDVAGTVLAEEEYYSVGGGFVLSGEEAEAGIDKAGSNVELPHPFESARELLEIGERTGLTIADIVLENEKAWRDEEEICDGLREIWSAMEGCIERGCHQDGILPGGLEVNRRAHGLYKELVRKPEAAHKDQLAILDWINLYALAVNEENAAGGRVVTAPTNGAAGVIPAVVAYYDRFVPGSNERGIFTMLATAAAIGMLYKKNASISAAEVGCQGEVGVACSMAAAGLTAAMGGTNAQIENAAEIGMEHNLGLTCDPIGGLVQIPCIERNTMGAVKAINAARLALKGDGTHKVHLDKVIETMRQTGADMSNKYKETSQGGLAVNVVEC